MIVPLGLIIMWFFKFYYGETQMDFDALFLAVFLSSVVIILIVFFQEKSIEINDEELIIHYTHCGFFIKPILFRLADISKVKMGKYSHQRGTPVLRIYRKNARVKRLSVAYLFEDAKDLQVFVRILKKRNIEVDFIGDYYYDHITKEIP